MSGGELSVACARLEPAGISPADADRLQVDVAAHVCATGSAWFSTVRHEGLTWLRFNVVNFRTRERHVDAVVRLVLEAAAALDAQPQGRADGTSPRAS